MTVAAHNDLQPPPGFVLDYVTESSATGEGGATNGTANRLPYFRFDRPFDRSQEDDYQYRLLRLPNQMQALLVQAKPDEAIKSCASLGVNVGHFADPPSVQGLAHFCEHLLFMGTEKYPKENEYSQYLSQHGGRSNAYTDMNTTNYHFSVNSEFFEGALDRFAQFFIAPLFNEDCTERELLAVDSEHKKNIQNDGWRHFQLDKSLADPASPYSKFGTGSLKTLKDEPAKAGINIRAELLAFHDQYYSANLMALAVYGRESLDQLTEWVVTKFSGVINKNTPYPQYHESPWKAEQLQRRINIEAAQSTRELTLVFPTADAKPQYDCNPVHYLSCLIGHEGSGSLLSYLKKQGWAIGLGAGSCLNDVVGFDAFSINIELTPAGLEHIEDMVVVVFEYIAMLKRVGPQEYYFNFLRDMSGIEFRFQPKPDPQSYCIGLATTLRYPWLRPEHLLVGRGVVREYIPAQIEAYLQQLVPDNMYYMVQAKELQLVDPLVEEHYGTKYELVPLTPELRDRLAHLEPDAALQMPPPNAFVPEDLTVHCVKRETPIKEPTLLVEQGSNRLWHKQDDTFGLPRGQVHVHLKSSICQSHPYNAVRFSLLMDMFEDALNEFFYDASEAGLRGSRDRIDDGLVLRFWGFNDKLPLFIQQTLQHFITFVPQQSRFKIIKEDQQRHLKDYRHAPSNSHAINDRKHLLRLCDWTNDECLAALEHVTLSALQQFHQEFLLRLGAEMLVLGNFTEQQAMDVAQTVLDALDIQVLCPDEESNNRSIVLTPGQQFIHQRQHPDPKQENAAISFVCAIGLETDRVLRAQVTLMDNIINEPFFDQLRTKETLGYIVWSRSIYQLSGQMSFEFVVQSERNPMYLESRIYAFLDKMLEVLEKMSEEQFEKHKRAVIAQKREKPKALSQETGRYWGRIQDLTFEFDKAETEIRYLSQLTHASLVAFYKQYLHPASPHFTKLSCHIVPHKQVVTPPYLINVPDCVDIVPNAASAMPAGAYPHSVALLGLHAYLAHHQVHPSLSELKALAREARVVDEHDTPAIEAFMDQVVELYYQPPPTKSTTTADTQADKDTAPAAVSPAAQVVSTMKKEGVMASFFRPSAQLLGEPPKEPVPIEMPSPRANGLQLPDNNFIMFSPRAFRSSQRLSSDVFPARTLTPKYPGHQWKAKPLLS